MNAKKVCKECGEPVKLTLPDSFITRDTADPLYPFEWRCKNGHIESAGYMTEDRARQLQEQQND